MATFITKPFLSSKFSSIIGNWQRLNLAKPQSLHGGRLANVVDQRWNCCKNVGNRAGRAGNYPSIRTRAFRQKIQLRGKNPVTLLNGEVLPFCSLFRFCSDRVKAHRKINLSSLVCKHRFQNPQTHPWA